MILSICVLYFFLYIANSQNSDLCVGENAELLCLKSSACSWFQKEYQRYSKLPKNSIERKEKQEELKSRVCSKRPRKVCCPTEVKSSVPTSITTTSYVNNLSPSWVPSGKKGECGLDIFSDFIVGGEITKMGEFPWAVLLGKPRGSQIKWHCGGSLINRWYVVSAAHCSPDDIKMVRVGEWKLVDTSKPNRRKGLKFSSTQRCRRCKSFRLVNGTYDCMETNTHQFVWPEDAAAVNAICAPPHQDIPADRAIAHPNYHRLRTGLVINDIMLVKLQRPVELSQYAAPACLPTGDFPRLLEDLGEQQIAKKPVVIGWGKSYDGDYNETTTIASAFQQKLEMPLVSIKDCGDIWSKKYKINLRADIRKENHLCAGGEKDKDSCKGDSGGPLVFRESDGTPTYLVGVVSAGTSRCGIGAPAIFTRVTTAMQWILDNIN